jgi:signal peptidase I
MRQILQRIILLALLLLLTHAFLLEVCEVSSGSMAPTLFGPHRAASCPRCGAPVAVNLYPGEKNPARQARLFQRARCWNCGYSPLGLEDHPDQHGRHVLLDKTAFLFRRPRRWEVVVLRLFGILFIKRVVGLPGETVVIKDGDIWIDGELARKTLAELRALAIPIFDSTYPPAGQDLRQRWHVVPRGSLHPLMGQEFHLDGTQPAQPLQFVVYENYFGDEHKSAPMGDEYACNGSHSLPREEVHDFLLECDVAVEQGKGDISFQVTDGADTIVAEVPIGPEPDKPGRLLQRKGGANFATGGSAPAMGTDGFAPVRVFFRPGSCYHVQVAFADRRATVRVDSQEAVLDLPPADRREGVFRPVAVGVQGGKVILRNLRLFRDVHYTQAGKNGVDGRAVPLLAGQYFVLGDNSPVSEDSRFWPDQGIVDGAALMGRAVWLPF